jgi:hypothetical protein
VAIPKTPSTADIINGSNNTTKSNVDWNSPSAQQDRKSARASKTLPISPQQAVQYLDLLPPRPGAQVAKVVVCLTI